MAARPLSELVEELPPDVQQEVRDFVEFLISKRSRASGKKLRQDWAGGLQGESVAESTVRWSCRRRCLSDATMAY